MEIRDAFRSLFAIACAVSAAVVQAVDFPNPAAFNPTWESAKPGTSYSTDLPTAALLGNGSLGAVNGGDGNHKKFVLTRGDIWSCGDFTCGNADANMRPISFADFNIGPGMHTVTSMKGGMVVRVEVKSEKGGRFRLVDPRTARGAVPAEVGRSPRDRRLPPGWTRGRTRNSGEATLERDFKPGEAVVLNPQEA